MFFSHYTQTYLVVLLGPYAETTLMEGQTHFNREYLFVSLAKENNVKLHLEACCVS